MEESRRQKLIASLEDALIEACRISKVEYNYSPHYFLDMLESYRAIGACERVILSKDTPEGFTTLILEGRLDLSVEHIVLTNEWKTLFSEEVLEIARQRLSKCGYDFNEWFSEPDER